MYIVTLNFFLLIHVLLYWLQVLFVNIEWSSNGEIRGSENIDAWDFAWINI